MIFTPKMTPFSHSIQVILSTSMRCWTLTRNPSTPFPQQTFTAYRDDRTVPKLISHELLHRLFPNSPLNNYQVQLRLMFPSPVGVGSPFSSRLCVRGRVAFSSRDTKRSGLCGNWFSSPHTKYWVLLRQCPLILWVHTTCEPTTCYAMLCSRLPDAIVWRYRRKRKPPLLLCFWLVGIDFVPEDINKWCAGVWRSE